MAAGELLGGLTPASRRNLLPHRFWICPWLRRKCRNSSNRLAACLPEPRMTVFPALSPLSLQAKRNGIRRIYLLRRIFMKTTRAAFASAMLILGLAACSSSRHEASEKYYLVVSNTKVAYWQTASAGLSQAGHKSGVAYDMGGPDSYDTEDEIQQS